MGFTPVIRQIRGKLDRSSPIPFLIARLQQPNHNHIGKASLERLNRMLCRRVNKNPHRFILNSVANSLLTCDFFGTRLWQFALNYIATKPGL